MKNINQKAFKAGIWYMLGNILLKGCVFLTLPIFTRIMSTSDFGLYNTYIAYEGILTAILGLGLYGSVKNAKLDYENDFDQYMSSIMFLCLLFLIVFTILGNITYNFYSNMFGFSRFITNCLILQSFGSCLMVLYGAKMNIEFNYKTYILLTAFNTIMNIILSILLIRFVFPHETYFGRIIGSAFPLIIIAFILTIYLLKKGKTFYNKRYWFYALKIGLPLIPHIISQSLLSQFDRIMINNMVSSSFSGIYSYMYTICTIIYVICCSIESSWTPWVYMKIKDNKNEEIKKYSIKLVMLFSLISISFMCIMPEITYILADKSYVVGTDLIIPLSLANYYIFMYMIPVGIEYYNKKTGNISLGTIGAAIVNIVLNAIAIKLFGFKAAAYTTLVSYIALYYFHRTIAKKYSINKYYDFKKISVINIITVITGFIILISFNFGIFSVIIRYIIVMIEFVILLTQRKIIISILKKGEKNEKNI